jgi:hypothetical protein
MNDALTDAKLEPLVGQSATIRGVARDARMGAVVLTPDRTPVYVAGLEEWPPDLEGEALEATGTLIRRKLAPDPIVDADGGVSHGVAGTNYVLEDAAWRRI